MASLHLVLRLDDPARIKKSPVARQLARWGHLDPILHSSPTAGKNLTHANNRMLRSRSLRSHARHEYAVSGLKLHRRVSGVKDIPP